MEIYPSLHQLSQIFRNYCHVHHYYHYHRQHHHHYKYGIRYFNDQHHLRPDKCRVTMEIAVIVSLQNRFIAAKFIKEEFPHSSLTNCTRI
jgi:hypothetical protein